jgi:hypothetical protein
MCKNPGVLKQKDKGSNLLNLQNSFHKTNTVHSFADIFDLPNAKSSVIGALFF